jgi:chromosomal replication initiation ATPase DnaA
MTTNTSHSPQQLVLELPHRQALGAEDFLVSRSNAAAVELVDAWPNWSHPAALVAGPKGAGKSHLAHVWQLKSGARSIAAADLADDAVQDLESRRALVVEDIDRGVANEQTLFHLLNLAREKKYSILLTSRKAPGEISIALPDLRSRLRALPLSRIEAPDVVAYLALHMERSMEAASQVVEAADRLSLAVKRKVTRAIAADALASLGMKGEGE